MEIIFFLIAAFLLWLLSRDVSAPSRKRIGGKGSLRSKPGGLLSTDRGFAQNTFKRESVQPPVSLREPRGNCICGCNGVPLTLLPEYSVDYNKYRFCPARQQRKQTGVYTDDSVRVIKWISADVKRRVASESRRAASKKKKEEERKKQEHAIKRERTLQRQARAEQEKLRHSSGAPALSAAEALRRGLETYVGKDCGVGHGGERHARNGECVECRRIDQRKRDAMRRGAYPRELTPHDRKRIGEIYAEARRLTKETGIEHHVDHIKPLAAGGEHHPNNPE